MLGISLAGILFRFAAVSPATAAFYRALYALPLLILLARRTRVDPRLRWLALGGGLLFGVDLVLWHAAIDRIGAGLATVLANTQVIWVGLGAWALQGERPPSRFFAALPLMMAGVGLLSGVGDAAAYGIDPIGGALLGIGGSLAYAAYLLVHRRACRDERLPIGQLRDATAGMGLAALICGWAGDPGFSLQPSWPGHGWLALLALVAQVGGWLALSTALPRLGAVQGSTLLLLQPVGTLIWGALLLAEAPSLQQLAGVAAILVGLAIVQLRRA